MMFSKQNCLVNLVIFFASFCWLRVFLPENLKLIDKLQLLGFESFIFWSKFCFLGTVLGRFNQCNFKIFCPQPATVAIALLLSC